MKIGCKCGKVSAEIRGASSLTVNRARCYCRDCQASAEYFGAEDILDEHGGTQVVQTVPSRIEVKNGWGQVGCLRLSERGLMRWYAKCCGAPLANTVADPKVSFVGFLQTAIREPENVLELEKLIGPCRFRVNTEAARGAKIERFGYRRSLIKIMTGVLVGKLTGAYKKDPFFDSETGKPIVSPKVLSEQETDSLYEKVDAARSM